MAQAKRLHSLDALRGLAALTVVFWHWQHFFYFKSWLPNGYLSANQPLYWLFGPLYESGWLAVDLFFTLSGFIFFWLYSERITAHQVTGRDFGRLRFSRLYPLHFLTLMVVIVGQAVYKSIHGDHFVYQHNDGLHLLLNLVMLPASGLESGHSFNGPFWSVSVEVILYALFFILCWNVKLGRLALPALATISALGFFYLQDWYEPLGRGVGSFFLGGCLYHLQQRILAGKRQRAWVGVLLAFAGILWALAAVWCYSGYDLPPRFAVLLLFPCTVLALAVTEAVTGPLGERLSWLGDISYSSYLWHFPLQLAFVLVGPNFYSPLTLGAFFAALIAISLASYRYIEMPAQAFLRGPFLDQPLRLSLRRKAEAA